MTKRKAPSSSSSSTGQTGGAAQTHDGSKKRKEKSNELADRVNKLEEENLRLRMQLKIGKETSERDVEEKERLFASLEQLVRDPDATTEKVEELLDEYLKNHSDYGERRRVQIQTHLTQLERLLLPSQVTKMAMWTLNQQDSFYAKDGISNLWKGIMDQIGASDDQTQKIKSKRDDARKLALELRSASRECKDLKHRMKRKNAALSSEMGELRTILSPVQLAKFIIWVNKNPITMEMLAMLQGNV